LTGAPNIQISGFDGVGQTPPEGRQDVTGHLADGLSYHRRQATSTDLAAIRRAQLEEFLLPAGLGNIKFDGSVGPWSTSNVTIDSKVKGTG